MGWWLRGWALEAERAHQGDGAAWASSSSRSRTSRGAGGMACAANDGREERRRPRRCGSGRDPPDPSVSGGSGGDPATASSHAMADGARSEEGEAMRERDR